LSKAGERLRRRISTPSLPDRCRDVNELKRNGKPNICSSKKSEKRESASKKSIEPGSNENGKSGYGKRSRDASVVSELEKNASKSVCGEKSGMRRSSASENFA
jgi:hypothetical protein